jgi:hypothetical protein
MSALELARAINAMRKLDMSDEEILVELKRGGTKVTRCQN